MSLPRAPLRNRGIAARRRWLCCPVSLGVSETELGCWTSHWIHPRGPAAPCTHSGEVRPGLLAGAPAPPLFAIYLFLEIFKKKKILTCRLSWVVTLCPAPHRDNDFSDTPKTMWWRKGGERDASLAVLYINNDSAAGSPRAPQPGWDQDLTVTSEEESSKHGSGGLGN